MIRVNLLPIKQAAQAERQRQELIRVGLGLALLASLFALGRIKQGHDISATEAQIVQVEERVKALDAQVKDVRDLEAKQAALDSKLKVIADLGHKRVGPVGVMTDLAKSVPDRVWLTDFSEAGGGAMLTGQAVDNQIVAEFLRNLGLSPYFTSVDLVETTQDQVGENKLRKFIVKAQIDYAATGEKPKAPAAGGKPGA
jgi:type IV pilus assembly protein PilN